LEIGYVFYLQMKT